MVTKGAIRSLDYSSHPWASMLSYFILVFLKESRTIPKMHLQRGLQLPHISPAAQDTKLRHLPGSLRHLKFCPV